MPEAVPDLVRCLECGAGNPVGSGWCGQCLRRFDGEDEPRLEIGFASASEVEPTVVPPIRPAGMRPAVQARDGGEPVWSCPACEAENPLSSATCSRCGSEFTSFFGRGPVDTAPRRSGRTAIALTALMPGSGHWIFRQIAPGVARALLYVWSCGISIMLLVWPPQATRAIVRGIGAIFALAAAGVWVLSMLETMRLAEGDHRLLIPPKALTWLAAGLSGLLMFGLLGAVIAGR